MRKLLILCLLFVPIYTLQAQWTHVGPVKDTTAGNMFETGLVDCIVTAPGFDGVTNQTLYAGSTSGGLWITTDFCASWNRVPIIDAIPYHGISAIGFTTFGQMLFSTYNVGAFPIQYGNIYIYDPSVSSWTSSDFSTVAGPGVRVNRIKSYPANPSIVLAATSNGVYRTTNGGWNWTQVLTGNYENVEFVPINVSPGYLVYVCGENIVKHSNDLGLTYTGNTNVMGVPSGLFYADMAYTDDAVNANTAYIYFDMMVWDNSTSCYKWHNIVRLDIDKTTTSEFVTNHGSITEPIYNGVICPERSCMAAYDKSVYFGCGGLGKYNIDPSAQGFYTVGPGVDAPTSSLPYWSPEHPDNHDALFLPSLNKLIYVNDGGVFMNSYTIGANNTFTNSWQEKNYHLNISQIWGLSCAEEDENEYMTGEQDTKAFRTNSTTTTFGSYGTEPSNVLVDKFNKNNYMYLSGSSIVGEYNAASFSTGPYSPGAGATDLCSTLTPNSNYGAPEFGNNTLFQDPNQPGKIYSGRMNSGLMEFCIASKKFSLKKDFTPSTWDYPYVNGLAFTKSDPNTVYASVQGRNSWIPGDSVPPKIFRYTGGNFAASYQGYLDTWTDVSPNYNAAPFSPGVPFPQSSLIQVLGVAVSDWDPDKIWVPIRNVPNNPNLKVLMRSGGTWTDYSTGIPSWEIPVCIVYEQGSNDGLYLGTNTNVYYRNASMSSWTVYSNSLPNIGINQLRINYKENTVRAGTYGCGMWKNDLYCPTNSTLTVTGTTSSNAFYEASGAVTVQNHSISSGNVKYRSGTVVDFLPDVLITASTQVTAFAFIHGCSAPGNTFRLASEDEDVEYEEIMYEEMERIASMQLNVYPNPSDGHFTIDLDRKKVMFEGVELENEEEAFDITVYNVLGQEVFRQADVTDEKFNIDLSGMPKGLYTVRCVSGDEIKTAKVICK